MTMELNISPLNDNDITRVVALVNSAYRGESSKKGWTTEADLLDGLRINVQALAAMVQQAGATMLVAKNKSGEIVGCVYLQKQEQQLYLGMLTVAPDMQANGIGKQLLSSAETYAKTTNCHSIIMTVIDIRHELIDWYIRKGYRRTGVTKPFPTNTEFGLPKQLLQFTVLEKTILR